MLGVLLAIALQAQAATVSESHVYPGFRDGELDSCAVHFLAVRPDMLHYAGQAVGLEGSIQTYRRVPFPAAVVLKAGVLEPGATTYVSPYSAYLITGFATNAADQVASYEGETAGFLITAFMFGEATFQALGDIGAGRFAVGVQREAGASAIHYSITLDDEAALEWLTCFGALSDLILEDLQ